MVAVSHKKMMSRTAKIIDIAKYYLRETNINLFYLNTRRVLTYSVQYIFLNYNENKELTE